MDKLPEDLIRTIVSYLPWYIEQAVYPHPSKPGLFKVKFSYELRPRTGMGSLCPHRKEVVLYCEGNKIKSRRVDFKDPKGRTVSSWYTLVPTSINSFD